MRRSDALLLSEARRAARDGSAKRLRIAAGMTQAEEAAVCGVTAATVSRWESGDRVPRGTAALRWARLLVDLRKSLDGAQADAAS